MQLASWALAVVSKRVSQIQWRRHTDGAHWLITPLLVVYSGQNLLFSTVGAGSLKLLFHCRLLSKIIRPPPPLPPYPLLYDPQRFEIVFLQYSVTCQRLHCLVEHAAQSYQYSAWHHSRAPTVCTIVLFVCTPIACAASHTAQHAHIVACNDLPCPCLTFAIIPTYHTLSLQGSSHSHSVNLLDPVLN